MSITATCGHILTDKEGFGTTIAIKDYCKDGSKAVSYPTLCNKCLKWYRKNKLELKTKKERECWLNDTFDLKEELVKFRNFVNKSVNGGFVTLRIIDKYLKQKQ